MRPGLWGLVALSAACHRDRDFDGSVRRQDCDDEDPSVYPGAPDEPGDRLDADCDGKLEPLPFVGTWALVDLAVETSGLVVIQPGSSTGTFVVDRTTGTLDLEGTGDPALFGYALPLAFAFAGEVSSQPDARDMVLFAEGDLFGEATHVDWSCSVEAQELDCAGEIKALEGSLDSWAHFVREE